MTKKSDSTMNFEVGDRIIEESRLEYAFNQYHQDKLYADIVRQADDRRFSYDESVKLYEFAGMYAYLVYEQKDGGSYSAGNSKVINLTKNKDLAKKIIKSLHQERIELLTFKENQKVDELKVKIERLQVELKELEKSGLKEERRFLRDALEKALRFVKEDQKHNERINLKRSKSGN